MGKQSVPPRGSGWVRSRSRFASITSLNDCVPTRYREVVLTVLHMIDDISKLALMLERKLHQSMAAVHTNFCADIISMILNCADTDAKLVSDLTTR